MAIKSRFFIYDKKLYAVTVTWQMYVHKCMQQMSVFCEFSANLIASSASQERFQGTSPWFNIRDNKNESDLRSDKSRLKREICEIIFKKNDEVNGLYARNITR